MSDEDDDPEMAQLYFGLIINTVMANNFDIDRTIQSLRRRKLPGGKRRVLDVLARWEAQIVSVERSTRNPEQRLVLTSRLLANLRKGRRAYDEQQQQTRKEIANDRTSNCT
jgi:hypothetical protein